MSKLFLVPTPVGNLEDITFRAVRILKEADILLAEDTRTSRVLLNHLGINKKLLAHHQHNEHQSVPEIIRLLKTGQTVALISDAGTPGISDPGFLLTREAIREDIEVYCLPGPTAFVPALVQSGLPCDRFIFEGFLPPKKGRQTRIATLAEQDATIVLYESPHRLLKTILQMIPFFGESRQAAVCREISKMHEETRRGTLQELAAYFEINEPRGEMVLVIAGKN